MEDRFKGKRNTNGFDKNKNNINTKGQPRKGVSYLNEKIKEKIGDLPSKKQIEDIVIGMLELTEQELLEVINDNESSVMIKIIAGELLNNDKKFNTFNILLDRGIGKAVQKVETKDTTGINESDLID